MSWFEMYGFIRERKNISINKFLGLSWEWVGGKRLFMCFFSGHSLWGRKSTKTKSPPNCGIIPWNFCSCVFSFTCFFLFPSLGFPQKGAFVKAGLRRMCPRSRFLYRRSFFCALVRFLWLQEHDSEHLPKPPVWKPPSPKGPGRIKKTTTY